MKRTLKKIKMVIRGTSTSLAVALALMAGVTVATMAALAATAGTAEAAFPGQNGKVAFYNNGDIWAMNPDGSGRTKLTTNVNTEKDPAVSPDGSKIAYEFIRGIWVMNADGSGQRMLTDGSGWDEDPAWSADGKKIAFSRGGKDIWAMNASDGSGQTNLTNNPSNEEREPAWSPSGDKIAYTRTGCEGFNGANCVYAMNADGSGQTNLTPEMALPQCPNSPGYFHNGASSQPAWSPDGQKIAFAGAVICPHGTGTDIWVMNADGGGKINLINDNTTSDTQPAFSPDGQKVVFTSNRGNLSSGARALYAMNADGSGITRLTPNDVSGDIDADWGTPPPPDADAPTGSVSVNAGAKSTKSRNVTLTLSAADNSGRVTRMCVSNSATSCTAWEPYATTKAWKLSGKTVGTKTVYVRYEDAAGNQSAIVSDAIKYAP